MAATTAVVAGTAGAVRHHQDQKYANQAAEQQQAYDEQVAAAQPAPAAAPAGKSMDQKMAELTQLGQLHDSGILTDDEFNAQKAAILAS